MLIWLVEITEGNNTVSLSIGNREHRQFLGILFSQPQFERGASDTPYLYHNLTNPQSTVSPSLAYRSGDTVAFTAMNWMNLRMNNI